MELCCSQYWSDLSDAKMSLKVTYHSLHSDTPSIKFVSPQLILVCNNNISLSLSLSLFIHSTVVNPGQGWMSDATIGRRRSCRN